jgi:hypothetical protein
VAKKKRKIVGRGIILFRTGKEGGGEEGRKERREKQDGQGKGRRELLEVEGRLRSREGGPRREEGRKERGGRNKKGEGEGEEGRGSGIHPRGGTKQRDLYFQLFTWHSPKFFRKQKSHQFRKTLRPRSMYSFLIFLKYPLPSPSSLAFLSSLFSLFLPLPVPSNSLTKFQNYFSGENFNSDGISVGV